MLSFIEDLEGPDADVDVYQHAGASGVIPLAVGMGNGIIAALRLRNRVVVQAVVQSWILPAPTLLLCPRTVHIAATTIHIAPTSPYLRICRWR